MPQGQTLQERIAWITESGARAIGTAEHCINQIEALWKQSGGFGTFLFLAHNADDADAVVYDLSNARARHLARLQLEVA